MYVGPWQEYKLMKVIEQVKAENTRLKSSQLRQHDQQMSSPGSGASRDANGGLRMDSYHSQRTAGGTSNGSPGYMQPTRRNSAAGHLHHAQSVDGRSQGSHTTQQSTQSAPPGLVSRPGGEQLYQSSKSFRTLVDPSTKTKNEGVKQPVISRNKKREQQLQQQKDALGSTAEDRMQRRTQLAMMYADTDGQQEYPHQQQHYHQEAEFTKPPVLQGRRAQKQQQGGGGDHTFMTNSQGGGLGPNVVSANAMVDGGNNRTALRPLNQSVISEMKSTYANTSQQQHPARHGGAAVVGGAVPWDDAMQWGAERHIPPPQHVAGGGGGGSAGGSRKPISNARRMDLGAPIQPSEGVSGFVPTGHVPGYGTLTPMAQQSTHQPAASASQGMVYQQPQLSSHGHGMGGGGVAPLNTDLLASANGRMMQQVMVQQQPQDQQQASTPRSPPGGMGAAGGAGYGIPNPPHYTQPATSESSPNKRPLNQHRISPAGFLEGARYSPLPTSAGGQTSSNPGSAHGRRGDGYGSRLNGTGVSVDGSQDVGSLLNWAENLKVPDF